MFLLSLAGRATANVSEANASRGTSDRDVEEALPLATGTTGDAIDGEEEMVGVPFVAANINR